MDCRESFTLVATGCKKKQGSKFLPWLLGGFLSSTFVTSAHANTSLSDIDPKCTVKASLKTVRSCTGSHCGPDDFSEYS